MPNYDRTGPRGRGPFTGRGMGYCVEPVNASAKPVKPVAVPVRPFYGRGFGRGRGRGRGWGRGRY